MKQRTHLHLAIVIVWAIPYAPRAQSGELAIVRPTFAPSTTSSNGGLVLRGTIGQADATEEPLVNGGLVLHGGFWTPNRCRRHPADLNGDFDIGPGDLSGYTTCFLRSCEDWPGGGPQPPPPGYVSRAATLFLLGGFNQVDYCCVPTEQPPLIWDELQNCAVAPAVASSRSWDSTGANLARREILPRGSSVDVRLRIRPPADSSAYALEEAVPLGLTVRAVSHGGMYSEDHGVIRWGPFLDNEPRDLTYRLIAEDGSKSTDLFEGIVSFDGYDTLIEGDRAIATLRGDADRDGDIDVADYLQLVECFSGTATPIPSDCDVFDFDGDGHVGLADLVAFQSAFTGTR